MKLWHCFKCKSTYKWGGKLYKNDKHELCVEKESVCMMQCCYYTLLICFGVFESA